MKTITIAILMEATLMVACQPVRNDATIPIDRNLHDESYKLNRFGSVITTPQFFDIFVFRTEAKGVDYTLPPHRALTRNVIFHSTSHQDIDEFVGFSGKGVVEWPGRRPGRTYHVILKEQASRDALNLRVFIPNDNPREGFIIGGVDLVWSLKDEKIATWVLRFQ